jgi:hypothetical protein
LGLGLGLGLVFDTIWIDTQHQLMKPLYGLISDLFPICGYRRKSYVAIFSVLTFVTWFCIGLLGLLSLDRSQRAPDYDAAIGSTCELAGDCASSRATFVVALLFSSFTECFTGVVVDSWVVERVKLKETKLKDTGKLQTVCTIMRIVGTLIASFCSGYLLESLSPPGMFLITSCCPVLVVGLALAMDENVFCTPSSLVGGVDVDVDVGVGDTEPIELVDLAELQPAPSSPPPLSSLPASSSSSSSSPSPSGVDVDVDRELDHEASAFVVPEAPAPYYLCKSWSDFLIRWRIIKPQLRRAWCAVTTGGLWRLALFLLLIFSAPKSFSAFFYFMLNELHFSDTTLGVLSLVANLFSIIGRFDLSLSLSVCACAFWRIADLNCCSDCCCCRCWFVWLDWPRNVISIIVCHHDRVVIPCSCNAIDSRHWLEPAAGHSRCRVCHW